jgi:hypothetical protein
LQSGQLNPGSNALTAISVPPGTAHRIAFGTDNGVANQQPPVLRVAIYHTSWYTAQIAVDGAKRLYNSVSRNSAKTAVISGSGWTPGRFRRLRRLLKRRADNGIGLRHGAQGWIATVAVRYRWSLPNPGLATIWVTAR